MRRESLIFVSVILLLVLSGCNRVTLPEIEGTDTRRNLTTNRIKIEDTLEELGKANLDWMARPGWVHYERIPVEEGIVKFSYQDRWTHYVNENGDCAEELWVIRKSKGSQEGQIRVRLADGTQGELVALRAGGEIPDYADPTQMEKDECQAKERSAPLIDLQEIRLKEEYVDELSLWEETLDGKEVIVLQVVYQGTDTSLLGIPTDAEGKLEQFYYDRQTGNRVKIIMEILYPGNEWKGETWTEEQYSFYEELPEDVAKELEQSEKELRFYLDLLTQK